MAIPATQAAQLEDQLLGSKLKPRKRLRQGSELVDIDTIIFPFSIRVRDTYMSAAYSALYLMYQVDANGIVDVICASKDPAYKENNAWISKKA